MVKISKLDLTNQSEKFMKKDLSLVVPVKNEQESLEKLFNSLAYVLNRLKLNYELIFVDDGSNDHSFSLLEKFHQEDGRVKVLQLRRNYGKSAALTAGFDSAQGEIVVTIDADLQDDVAEIPNLVNKINEGYDVVCGLRRKRRDSLFKIISSKVFNSCVSIFTGVRIKDINTGFKAYRLEVLKGIEIYGGLYRFLPVLAHRAGFKIIEIPVKHFPRQFGKSKYGPSKIFDGFIDLLTVILLTKYSEKPAHFFGGAGLLAFVAGFLINIYLTILWFLGERPIGNRPLFFLGILLLIIGIQLISLGLLGEILIMGQKKKTYQIKTALDK